MSEGDTSKLNKGPMLGIRHLQVIMLFLAMVICYTMRINISMAIVVMTDKATEGCQRLCFRAILNSVV
ncbi:hypothetical protein PYW08_004191 [Mythimna loreyi]|uniref:Uncharacterized protein n=1 Tax=Mythimna loreyi TaxID=667449 RepID=A0ACC2QQF4_9NEOP|nr:hypothetical protein PYW08_004191 [Mythimna loreyi]